MTLYDWLLVWLNKYEKMSIKRTTYVNYEGHIMNHFIVFQDTELNDITTPDLQDFFNGQIGLGFSAKTVRNMAMIIRKALKQAVVTGLVNQNCALNVTLPKVVKREILVLTHEQEETLIRESYFFRFGTFVRLVLCTGLRLGEVLGLQWDDIDFCRNELKIRRILHRCKNYDPTVKHTTSIYLDEPKTAKSKRIIPLPSNAVDDLKAWKEKQSGEIRNPVFVVTSPEGKALDPTTFKKYYNRLLEKCGIKGITFHALRHTFATNALENGMDVKVLSEILGHASVSFTLDTYTHVLNTFKRQNMDLMNNIYPNKTSKRLVLSFKPFKNQYVVSIPGNTDYTFIADSIQDGIDYINTKKDAIVLNKTIDVQQAMASKGPNDIVICLN